VEPSLAHERLFQAIFDEAGIGLAISDLDGRVLRCNRALSVMLGYAEEELVGADPEDFVHEDDGADGRSRFRELREGRIGRYDLERLFRRRDGQVARVRMTVTLARDARGAPAFAIGTLEDITEQDRAERAVQEREHRLRLLTEQMPAVVWTVDREMRFTSSTGGGLKALGLRQGEVVGWTLQRFFGTDDESFEPLAVHRAAIAGRSGSYELEWQRNIYQTYVEPLRDERGTITGAIGVAHDVTGQRHAEAALDQSEELRRTITESCPDNIMVLDLKGRILFINRTVPDLTVEGVLGKAVYDFMPAESHARVRACFERVIATREPDRYAVEYHGVPDRVTFFENRVWPVLRGGEVYALTVYCTDVTQRRLLEEQLIHAQKMESVGRLAGGVAHDLNNQLSVVLGSAEIARLGLDDPARVTAELERIGAAARKAATLTRQLLAFGRRQVLQPRVLDLNELVGGVREILERVSSADVRLRFALAPGLPSVRVDPTQIEQVILNLAINALDAMPDGGTLTLSTAIEEVRARPAGPAPGRYVVLSVRDTGTGMEPEVLARAFEPFFTTKEVGKGTGLGLSVVHGIVTQSGGHVAAQSEPGQGASFRIYLPAVDARPAAPPPPETDAGGRGGTETILLVEDEELVRTVTQALLEERGYRVLAAPNAEQALEICRAECGRIALLLSDVVMPGLSGQELARAAAKVCPGLRVILMSGYAERRGEVDAWPFLQKPVAPSALTRTIREVLDRAPR